MSRVAPVPVEVLVAGEWRQGTVRTCEVSHDRETCTAVVSWGGPVAAVTGRFAAEQMRGLDGTPGCPAAHEDMTCCATSGRSSS
jgi:hypothetical protein